MQSAGEHSFLHSCFDTAKNAIMGCCFSICHKGSDIQENVVNERTHLLEVPEREQEAPARPVSATTPPRKPDEQSALNRILQETATNVIDVAALGPYSVDTSVYNERVRAYSTRLAGAPSHQIPQHKLLRDVPNAERMQILVKTPITTEDKELIANAVKKAAAAISELRVEHHEDLVVPFRVP